MLYIFEAARFFKTKICKLSMFGKNNYLTFSILTPVISMGSYPYLKKESSLNYNFYEFLINVLWYKSQTSDFLEYLLLVIKKKL